MKFEIDINLLDVPWGWWLLIGALLWYSACGLIMRLFKLLGDEDEFLKAFFWVCSPFIVPILFLQMIGWIVS